MVYYNPSTKEAVDVAYEFNTDIKRPFHYFVFPVLIQTLREPQPPADMTGHGVCAIMKQRAFVHMREEATIKAIRNGGAFKTWLIFVDNVSSAYGWVVEYDVIQDYPFVHMEREGDASEAIENLNGRDLKGKRINAELPNKVQKRTNGTAPTERTGRTSDFREVSQGRAEALEQRRATEAAYASYGLPSPYEQYASETARYESYENRPRPPSPLYYARDRSPMRRSPNRSTYAAAQTSAALASQYRSQAVAYGSQAALASAYGNQASAALASAYGNQASALASAYGNQASALASAYGNQAAAAALAAAYGNQASAYAAQPAAYGTEAAVSYSAQASAYGAQGSTLSTAYGTQVSAMASPYGTQVSTSPYVSQASATSQYASQTALANAYRQQQNSAYEASQFPAIAQQQATFSNLPAVAADTAVYERNRAAQPQTAENFKTSADNLKRLASDRRYSELADYRRLSESQAAYRRSPPKPETQTDYSQYPTYSDYLRAAQLHASYQRRM
ncbi:LOW QUALITY PROTEIN: uncharacterized protein RCH25_048862 [Pelodytes ibericus]